MSFCQACGAKNADDARFCNACGARIVEGRPGPGGASAAAPAPPAAPPTAATGPMAPGAAKEDVWAMASQRGLATPGATGSGTTTGQGFSNQTLSGVGIPSRRSTLGTLAAVALTCLALGALLAWLVMRPGEAPADGAATADPGGSAGEAAEALPAGVDEPDDPSFEEGRGSRGGARGGAGGATGAAAGGSTTAGTTTGGTTTGGGSAEGSASGGAGSGRGDGAAGGGAGSAGAAGSTGAGGTGAGTGSGGGRAAGAGATGTGGGAGGTTAGAGGEAAGSAGGTGGGSAGGAGTTGGRDWGAMDEGGGDTDYETTLYVNSVRRYIQNHYARQATSCFGRASAESGAAVGGRVVVGFTISATGATEGVHVVRNDSGVEALGACLVNRVDSWEMPRPPRGEPVELALPFSS